MVINTIKSIASTPYNQPVVGLMRHAEREAIPKGELGNEKRITDSGIANTLSLHQYLKNRLVEIFTSPVLRCVETARCLKNIAKYPSIKKNKMLGDPGILVEDPEVASHFFLELSPIEIVTILLNKKAKIPGFCLSPSKTVNKLLIHALKLAVEEGIYLFITHDSILAVVIGILFPDERLDDIWPDFLETLFLYKEGHLLYAIYRGQKKPLFPYECLGK